MDILKLLVTLLPNLMKLMQLAEKAFSGIPKSGVDKKNMVMSAIEAIVSGIETASAGGQKNTWTQIHPFVSGIVDNATSVAFKPESMNTEDLRS